MSDLRALLAALAEAGDSLANCQLGDSAGDAYELFTAMCALPDALERVAGGISAVARVMADGPFETPVRHAVDDVASFQHTAAGAAEDLETIFRREHEREIQRFENPRQGEATWNV